MLLHGIIFTKVNTFIFRFWPKNHGLGVLIKFSLLSALVLSRYLLPLYDLTPPPHPARSLGEIGRHNSAPRNMDGGGGGGGGDSHSSSLNLFPLSVPNLSMFGGRLSRRNSTNPTPQETGSGYGSRRSVLLEEEEGEGREEEGGGGEGNGVTTATAAAAAVVPPEDGNGSGNENGNRNGQSDSDPDLNIAPKVHQT